MGFLSGARRVTPPGLQGEHILVRGQTIVRLTPNILLSSGDQDDVMMSLMLLAVAAGRRDLGKGSML